MVQEWYFESQGHKGPTLLLLHGLGASSFSWRHNLTPLARHFQVLSVDLPGHGRSPAPLSADYHQEALARGIMDFLQRRGIRKAAVAGNSLGGGLALMLARDYPERVEALILLAPAVALRRVPWLFYPLRLPGLGLMAAALLGPWIIPLALRLALRRICRQLQVPPWSEIEALLSKIYQPTAIVWGEEDRILPVAQAAWLKARLPQAELRLLPEIGHAPQEEAPATVNKIIIAFLTRSFKK